MTEFRDKKRDIKTTAEYINNKENIPPKEKSWLDHTRGSAVLDFALLKGATINQMIVDSGRQKESVIGHIKHLETEHGLIVVEKDGIHTLVSENSKLFDAVKLEHINKALNDFITKGVPSGLSSSKFYDVKINDTLYPPKPIMAYANYHASGIEPNNYFSGGANTPCFKAFERLGFEIVSKGNSQDVTEEFATWLQSNTFDSYRNYIGATTDDTILKLKEIDQFFPEIELFKINDSKIKQHSNKILTLLKKKERVKNEDFVEYDKKNSNGIPKAIIGKNNYLKFLKDKFVMNYQSKTNEQLDTLISEFKLYLNSSNLSSSSINTYSRNFELAIKNLFKDNLVKQLSQEDFKTYSKLTFYKFEKLTYKAYGNAGKGVSYFTSFFKNKLIEEKKPSIPVNQILYGPPGTGKTYYLKNKLFEKYTSTESNITKEENFTNVVSQCSWWQVIAIALLELGTCKVNDINAHPWVLKKASLSNSKTIRPTLWGQLQSHTVLECPHVNVSGRANPLLFSKSEDSYWEIDKEITQEVAPELLEWLEAVNNFKPNPDKIIERFTFVTFHQSFAYEDFIEGIKPVFSENETGDLGYQVEEGVFKEICNKAKNDPANKYAIFIDEINRANVSAVFGELITLIETDKRLGTKNELQIKLPYSKTLFGVPANLDIYGTMNTADRSIEALDTALRRRFSFVEMMPDTSILKNEIEGVSVAKILETINKRIEVLLDRDHAIGHSYFINCSTIEELEDTFKNNIIPLLQEYFYGDYGKIGLILGEGFVEKVENDDSVFSSFEYDGRESLVSSSYELIPFYQIDFSNAIEKLGN